MEVQRRYRRTRAVIREHVCPANRELAVCRPCPCVPRVPSLMYPSPMRSQITAQLALDQLSLPPRRLLSRSTVYLSFGTRSALMSKILDDSLGRAGFGRLRACMILPDALEAMEKTLTQTALVYSSAHAVLRRMLLLAKLDRDVARDYQQRQQRRAAGMRDLAQRLEDQQRLRNTVSVEEAATVLWVLTSFETFDQLFAGWGLDATRCGERIAMIARSSLLE